MCESAVQFKTHSGATLGLKRAGRKVIIPTLLWTANLSAMNQMNDHACAADSCNTISDQIEIRLLKLLITQNILFDRFKIYK